MIKCTFLLFNSCVKFHAKSACIAETSAKVTGYIRGELFMFTLYVFHYLKNSYVF